MEDDREASASASAAAPSDGGSIKPWVFVLLLSAFIVIFLPTFFSTSRGFRLVGVKGGWDSVNFVLVLFAILCGVLGRRRPEDDAERSPLASPTSNAWLVDADGGYGASPIAQSGYFNASEGDRATGIRRMRSSSSYPDLRQEATAAWGDSGVGEGFRFYDDIQLYRRRSEQPPREIQSFRSTETKNIPVDTFVLRRSPSSRSRSPPPLPSQQHLRRRSVQKVSENLTEKDVIFEPEKSHPSAPPSVEGLPQRERHRRGRSLDKVPEMEAKQDSSFAPERQYPSPLETSPSTLRHRRRRSLETLPENFAPEKPNVSPPAAPSKHRRRRSVDDIWGLIGEKAATFDAEKPRTPALAPPVFLTPPPPLPPPLPQEKRSSKKRSGGGTKDIASALASFYQKKMKGNKKNRAHDDISLHLNTTTSSSLAHPHPPPPPPPPPPPSSVFSQLFSKKSGSKSQRIYSLSSSTMAALTPPPPPPPFPPPSRYSRLQREVVNPPSSPPPPPPPRRINRQVPQPPPLPPPSPPRSRLGRKKEKSNFSRFSTPPLSPLPPPPPPPPIPESYLRQTTPADEVESSNGGSNGVEVSTGQTEATPGVTVFCPSPDVNNKADLFIARFRAGLKLEKMNSLREKERQKVQQQPPEEEFMMVGGLFDDDDDDPKVPN